MVRPCKGCGRLVAFVKDDEGKIQVLDLVAPVYGVASFTGFEGEDSDNASLRELAEGKAAKGTLRVRRETGAAVSHFATCPKASDFSKKGGARGAAKA